MEESYELRMEYRNQNEIADVGTVEPSQDTIDKYLDKFIRANNDEPGEYDVNWTLTLGDEEIDSGTETVTIEDEITGYRVDWYVRDDDTNEPVASEDFEDSPSMVDIKRAVDEWLAQEDGFYFGSDEDDEVVADVYWTETAIYESGTEEEINSGSFHRTVTNLDYEEEEESLDEDDDSGTDFHGELQERFQKLGGKVRDGRMVIPGSDDRYITVDPVGGGSKAYLTFGRHEGGGSLNYTENDRELQRGTIDLAHKLGDTLDALAAHSTPVVYDAEPERRAPAYERVLTRRGWTKVKEEENGPYIRYLWNPPAEVERSMHDDIDDLMEIVSKEYAAEVQKNAAHTMDQSKVLAIDFNGTIAGRGDDWGDPQPGAVEAMQRLKDEGFTICINSVVGDKEALAAWLDRNGVVWDYINEGPAQPSNSSDKINAVAYVDDRAIPFRGDWDETLDDLFSSGVLEKSFDGWSKAVVIKAPRIERVPQPGGEGVIFTRGGQSQVDVPAELQEGTVDLAHSLKDIVAELAAKGQRLRYFAEPRRAAAYQRYLEGEGWALRRSALAKDEPERSQGMKLFEWEPPAKTKAERGELEPGDVVRSFDGVTEYGWGKVVAVSGNDVTVQWSTNDVPLRWSDDGITEVRYIGDLVKKSAEWTEGPPASPEVVEWITQKCSDLMSGIKDTLVARYGAKTATAIIASAQALSWGAFATTGIPIPSAVTMIPGAVLAEAYRAVRGGPDTKSADIDEADIDEAARELMAALVGEVESDMEQVTPVSKRVDAKCKRIDRGLATSEHNDDDWKTLYIMSTGEKDRDGETVAPEGIDFSDYRLSRPVLFDHNQGENLTVADKMPIGRLASDPWLEEIGEGTKYERTANGESLGPKRMALLGWVEFSKANPNGKMAYDLSKEGVLGGSISFIPDGSPKKNAGGGNHYERSKLIEFTITPTPSNPSAVALSKKIATMAAKDNDAVSGQQWDSESIEWRLAVLGESDLASGWGVLMRDDLAKMDWKDLPQEPKMRIRGEKSISKAVEETMFVIASTVNGREQYWTGNGWGDYFEAEHYDTEEAAGEAAGDAANLYVEDRYCVRNESTKEYWGNKEWTKYDDAAKWFASEAEAALVKDELEANYDIEEVVVEKKVAKTVIKKVRKRKAVDLRSWAEAQVAKRQKSLANYAKRQLRKKSYVIEDAYFEDRIFLTAAAAKRAVKELMDKWEPALEQVDPDEQPGWEVADASGNRLIDHVFDTEKEAKEDFEAFVNENYGFDDEPDENGKYGFNGEDFDTAKEAEAASVQAVKELGIKFRKSTPATEWALLDQNGENQLGEAFETEAEAKARLKEVTSNLDGLIQEQEDEYILTDGTQFWDGTTITDDQDAAETFTDEGEAKAALADLKAFFAKAKAAMVNADVMEKSFQVKHVVRKSTLAQATANMRQTDVEDALSRKSTYVPSADDPKDPTGTWTWERAADGKAEVFRNGEKITTVDGDDEAVVAAIVRRIDRRLARPGRRMDARWDERTPRGSYDQPPQRRSVTLADISEEEAAARRCKRRLRKSDTIGAMLHELYRKLHSARLAIPTDHKQQLWREIQRAIWNLSVSEELSPGAADEMRQARRLIESGSEDIDALKQHVERAHQLWDEHLVELPDDPGNDNFPQRRSVKQFFREKRVNKRPARADEIRQLNPPASGPRREPPPLPIEAEYEEYSGFEEVPEPAKLGQAWYLDEADRTRGTDRYQREKADLLQRCKDVHKGKYTTEQVADLARQVETLKEDEDPALRASATRIYEELMRLLQQRRKPKSQRSRTMKRKSPKRKLWVNKSKKQAWLLKSEGPIDQEMQAYLEKRELDDVRVEDCAPDMKSDPGFEVNAENEDLPERKAVDDKFSIDLGYAKKQLERGDCDRAKDALERIQEAGVDDYAMTDLRYALSQCDKGDPDRALDAVERLEEYLGMDESEKRMKRRRVAKRPAAKPAAKPKRPVSKRPAFKRMRIRKADGSMEMVEAEVIDDVGGSGLADGEPVLVPGTIVAQADGMAEVQIDSKEGETVQVDLNNLITEDDVMGDDMEEEIDVEEMGKKFKSTIGEPQEPDGPISKLTIPPPSLDETMEEYTTRLEVVTDRNGKAWVVQNGIKAAGPWTDFADTKGKDAAGVALAGAFKAAHESANKRFKAIGPQVQFDPSGQGHAWRNIADDDIPADVVQEIEGEIIDGGQETCDDFVASNGQHYRWKRFVYKANKSVRRKRNNKRLSKGHESILKEVMDGLESISSSLAMPKHAETAWKTYCEKLKAMITPETIQDQAMEPEMKPEDEEQVSMMLKSAMDSGDRYANLLDNRLYRMTGVRVDEKKNGAVKK